MFKIPPMKRIPFGHWLLSRKRCIISYYFIEVIEFLQKIHNSSIFYLQFYAIYIRHNVITLLHGIVMKLNY